MNRIAHSIAYGTTCFAAAIAASLIAGTARAEGPIVSEPTTPFTSSRTRAEVRAEMLASGGAMRTANEWDRNQHTFASVADGRTRAQVTAEYMNARNEVHALNREDSGSSYLASQRAMPVPTGAMLAGSNFR